MANFDAVNERTEVRLWGFVDDDDVFFDELAKNSEPGDRWNVYSNGRLAYYWDVPVENLLDQLEEA